MSNKDLYYKNFTLADEKVIELLLEYRHKYDENMYLQNETCFTITGVAALNQELIALYADLDSILDSIKLSPLQKDIIRLIHEGYTYNEIEELTSAPTERVRTRINTICKAIKQENDRRWRKVTYIEKLGLKTKRCSKCKESLPATDEFFSLDANTIDFCNSRCKRCRNQYKKSLNVKR